MNTPEYRKAYLENLKTEISNNNKNLTANKNQPAYSKSNIQLPNNPVYPTSQINKKNKN
jgi:hypothetical protein